MWSGSADAAACTHQAGMGSSRWHAYTSKGAVQNLPVGCHSEAAHDGASDDKARVALPTVRQARREGRQSEGACKAGSQVATPFSPLFGDKTIHSQLCKWPTAMQLSWSAAEHGQRAACAPSITTAGALPPASVARNPA